MATESEANWTLAAFFDSLLDNPNVTYAAVVGDGDDFFIEVGILSAELDEDAKSLSTEEMFSGQAVPESLPIPDEGGVVSFSAEGRRIAVRTFPTDRIEAQWTDHHRPAEGGDSVGNARFNSAGTLGAAVTVSTHPGAVFVLTNWHVLVGGGGQNGDSVLQPGRLDGGRAPADWIANLTWSALNAKVDVAIAKVRDPFRNYVNLGRTRGHGQISGLALPSVGMQVKKSGRTTNVTTGSIRSVNAAVNVGGYPGGTRRFTNQILTSSMSRPGDSGSVLLSSDNRMVGLLFAGDSTNITVHNRADEVNNALRSSLAAGQAGELLGFQ